VALALKLNLLTCDLITLLLLAFQPLNGVTRVMGFVPASFQLTMPFGSQLRVRHGTDRQTDNDHRSIMPHSLSMGQGHNKADLWAMESLRLETISSNLMFK